MEEVLIANLYRHDLKAQEYFYKKLANKMFMVCYRYLGNELDAAEVLNDGFYKAFSQIHSFKSGGVPGLQAWIRKIVVNECLQFLRRKKKIWYTNELEALSEQSTLLADVDFEAEEYFMLIKELPETYRTVFNLFVIEGYSHKEIAEMLLITENTSRSFLLRAREELKRNIEKKDYEIRTRYKITR